MSDSPLRETAPGAIADNAFKAIGQDWMLVTAGDLASFNTMTASWGGMGILWGKPVTFAFVRPQRYTFGFMERAAAYSLTFFGEDHRDILNYCGTHSGRNVDKAAQTGLSPMAGHLDVVLFAEARLAFECRKLYAQDIAEASFVDTGIIEQVYGARDFHRMYVGEIVKVWEKP